MYPIYFKDNTCVKCGGINTIRTLDINNNPISSESSADIREVICNVCKAKYILQWNSSVFYPVDKYNVCKFIDNFNN